MDIQYATLTPSCVLYLLILTIVLSVADSAPSDTAAWLAKLNDAQREAVEYGAGNPTQPCW
jgi:DNA helicase-2/ATP-dependent DNA helicase PcrA